MGVFLLNLKSDQSKKAFSSHPSYVWMGSCFCLLLLWLPAERSKMPSALAFFLLLLFLIQPGKFLPERAATFFSLPALAANGLLAVRFYAGWLPSKKVLRLAHTIHLSPAMVIGCVVTVLTLLALPAMAQLIQQAICWLLNGPSPDCIAAGRAVHYSNLDVLKAVLAVLIFFHHYQQSFNVRFVHINFFHGTLELAWIVELFFMISGFLTVISHKNGQKRLLSFLKKSLRFYPSVWLSMTFVIATAVLFDRQVLAQLTIGDFFKNYLLLFSGFGISTHYTLNTPAWYLCILLLCYGLYYTIDFLCSKVGINRFAVFALAAFASVYCLWLVDFPFFNYSSFRGYASFFLGAALALPLCTRTNHSIGMYTLAAFVLSVFVLITQPGDYETIVMALYPGLLIAAVRLPQLRRELWSALGKCSFQLYLWHSPLFRLVKVFLPQNFPHSPFTMLLALVVAELYACLIYNIFEKPVANIIQQRFHGMQGV